MNKKTEFYTIRVKKLDIENKKLKAKTNKLSILRLSSLSIGIVLFYIIFSTSYMAASVVLFLSLVLLCVLIKKTNNIQKLIETNKRLIEINNNEISIISNNTNNIFSDGSEFSQTNHPYTDDLDILGYKSLYHNINRCSSKLGKQILAHALQNKDSKENIEQAQKAIQELSSKINWRQDLYQYSKQKDTSIEKTHFISMFKKDELIFEKNIVLSVLIRIMPIVSLMAIFIAVIWTYTPLIFVLICNIAINTYTYKIETRIYNKTNHLKQVLKSYAYILTKIENGEWHSKYMIEIKKELFQNNNKASKQIQQLNKYISYFDHRNNIAVQLTINTFFLWNVNIHYKIESWIRKNMDNTDMWMNSIAKLEYISSLANLSFNNEQWQYPIISNNRFTLETKDIAHPLISVNNRIGNDYCMNGKSKIDIITGSNMSGKSTFLRCLGINMVLAYTGAPVCASYMKVSIADIYTSMRIKDSIENNESSFYAELKRIKLILDNLNPQSNYFILLDEILRGTNSKDKFIGSKALTKQLLIKQTNALIATHDLELSVLEKEHPTGISNKFFDITINKEDLFFSYKINQGVCTSFNAPILMKKMGIDLSILN